MKNTIAKVRFFFIIPLVCLGFFSCIPEESFLPGTVLEFNGVQFWVNEANPDSVVGMSVFINYQDGDGTMGFLGTDTTHNLFAHVFERTSDTSYRPMQTIHPTDPENWIKSFAVRSFSSGPVRGMFRIDFIGDFQLLQRAPLGIVRFKIYMYDRDLVRSNEVITPDIRIR